MNPLVLPAAAAHFLLSGLLERHSHCYVWAREYESGGRMWSQVGVRVRVRVRRGLQGEEINAVRACTMDA